MKLNDKYILEDLKKIPTQGGEISKLLDKSNKNFYGFGELYTSSIKKNQIRAWKKHKKMKSNLIVIKGTVKFVLIDNDFKYSISFILSENKLQRLSLYEDVWFGFMGMSENDNTILNLASIEHDENEISRVSFETHQDKFFLR